MTEHFDHSDFCHCLDWKSDFCPETCFRARLARDLKREYILIILGQFLLRVLKEVENAN